MVKYRAMRCRAVSLMSCLCRASMTTAGLQVINMLAGVPTWKDPCFFVFWCVNIVLAEYESSATIRYKNIGKKDQEWVSHQGGPWGCLCCQLQKGEERSRGGNWQKGERCQRELKGFGLGKVIGIPRQSAFWLRSVGVSWQPSQRA